MTRPRGTELDVTGRNRMTQQAEHGARRELQMERLAG